jgi:transcriptional regulator with XRE-family HTH domain
MSPEPAAAALGVTTRTLRRWEQGEVAVPAERLDEVCRVLGAAPQERAALERQRLWLGAPEPAGSSSLEALEQQCDAYQEQLDRGQAGPFDLHFLALEARLWPRAAASHDKAAQRLLAKVYSFHANFLEGNGREREEVRGYAERALDLAVGRLGWEPWWQTSVHSLVWAAPAKRDAAGSRRRVALARGWLGLSADPLWQSALYRDMAGYATDAGDTAAAVDWAGRAHLLAQDQDDPLVLHLAGHVWGRALLAAGRPGEALALLPSDGHASPHQQLWDACYRVEARLALLDRSGAQEELGRAFALCREHDLPTGLPGELAQRL